MLNDVSITLVRGTDRTIKVVIQDPYGLPVDLTGATGYLTVKHYLDDAAALFTKSTGTAGQGAIAVPKSGVMEFYLLATDTNSLTPGSYVYDVQVVLSTSKRYAVISASKLELQYDVG